MRLFAMDKQIYLLPKFPVQSLQNLPGHLPGRFHLLGLGLSAVDRLLTSMPHGEQGLGTNGGSAALEQGFAYVRIVHLCGLKAKSGRKPGLEGTEKFVVEAAGVPFL